MRNTEIESLLFPVELRPVYFGAAPPQESLFDTTSPDRKAPVTVIASHRAVVDVERNRALGVVGRNYKLLLNEEAFALATQAFAQYFTSVAPDEFEVYNVMAPQTRSYCQVDFIHRDYRVDRWEQDTWLPYLRVTNSYNGSRALRLELGFVREACSNGLIFTKETVEVRINHTRRALGKLPTVRIAEGVARLRALEAEFVAYLSQIRSSPVPRLYAVPLMAKALGLDFKVEHEDAKQRGREREKLSDFRATARALVQRYTEEMGSNAYAVFNAATDYASHLEAPRDRVRIAPLQVRLGGWLREYAAAAAEPSFDLDTYVGEALDTFDTD